MNGGINTHTLGQGQLVEWVRYSVLMSMDPMPLTGFESLLLVVAGLEAGRWSIEHREELLDFMCGFGGLNGSEIFIRLSTEERDGLEKYSLGVEVAGQ